MSTTTTAKDSILSSIRLDNSWIAQLSPETPENLFKSREAEGLPDFDDNHHRRPVFNGHYVFVKPVGLKKPKLLLVSRDVAKGLLKLDDDQIASQDFVDYVSGNLVLGDTWATPYALSIMGTRYTNNCPYGTGDGYGDGRAISIGEMEGYELQLKGAGKTPFCRGADGRAVLRSSIREFLASEANSYMGVPTTRALSLVLSEEDSVPRPWYSHDMALQLPSLDDPRLESYTMEQRRQIIAQLRNQKADPNLMQVEPCAITCRVAQSFVRIGHLDLFARRAQRQSLKSQTRYDTSTMQWKELEEMVWHACWREYKSEAYVPFIRNKDLPSAAKVFLEESATKIATMVAHWIRVGFAQGNFNADNCLVGGVTMDYGPFGYLEEYSPLFAKWTGSGEHFAFMNQPSAGFTNYQVLVESVVPVIAAASPAALDEEDPAKALVDQFMTRAKDIFEGAVDQVFRQKMGFEADAEEADALWQSLEPLMRQTRVDWTLFWRRLTMIAAKYPDYGDETEDDYKSMLATLIEDDSSPSSPFYEPLSAEHQQQYLQWIQEWRTMLGSLTEKQEDIAESMRMTNPKYILREWMLVEAYKKAGEGDMEELERIYELVQNPYEEGTPQQENAYFRRAPNEVLGKGGTAFMS